MCSDALEDPSPCVSERNLLHLLGFKRAFVSVFPLDLLLDGGFGLLKLGADLRSFVGYLSAVHFCWEKDGDSDQESG